MVRLRLFSTPAAPAATALVVMLLLLSSTAALRAQQMHTVRPSDLSRITRGARVEAEVQRVGGEATEAVQSTANLRLAAGEALALRVDTAAARVGEGVAIRPDRGALPEPEAGGRNGLFALPFRYLAPSATTTELVVLRPVFAPGRRLRYDAERNQFRGSFYIALQDTLHPSSSQALAASIQLMFAAEADSIAPEQLELSRTNRLQEVAVLSRMVVDSVRVRIVPEFDLAGVDVWLPAEPVLVFETHGATVAGLGLGSTQLTLGLRGGAPREPVRVVLEAEQGTVEPAEVMLGGAVRVATVRVRSQGLGPTRVRAVSPQLGSAEVPLRFAWPIAFLLSCLLGGTLGGLTAFLYARRANTPASVREHVLTGAASGVVAAIAYYAIGVSLLHVTVDVRYLDEAAVFALAALAGLFGIPALNALKKLGAPK